MENGSQYWQSYFLSSASVGEKNKKTADGGARWRYLRQLSHATKVSSGCSSVSVGRTEKNELLLDASAERCILPILIKIDIEFAGHTMARGRPVAQKYKNPRVHCH